MKGNSRVALAGLILCAVTGLVVSAAQDPRQKQARSPRAETAEQLAHARLHDQGFEQKPRLTDDLIIQPNPRAPSVGEAPDYLAFLREQTCGADLVASGVVQDVHSMLNQSETFIFSDYQVNLKQVVRSNNPIALSVPITISRLGGEVTLNGKRVRAINSRAPLLNVGHHYLFFLEALSAGRDFKSREKLAYVWDQGRQVVISPRGVYSPREFFFKPFRFSEILADVKTVAGECR